MSFFEKNIEVLRAKDKSLAQEIEAVAIPEDLVVTESKSGLKIAKLGKVALHSGYHPEREGASFIEGHPVDMASHVVVFGFGFGYHLASLACKPLHVIVIEPSKGVIRSAFENLDLTKIIGKITLVSPEGFTDSVSSSIDYSSILWMDHAPTASLFKKERNLLAEPFNIRTINASRKYKVMVVGPVAGGSHPTAVSCSNALSRLGFTVDFVDNSVHGFEKENIKSVTPDRANQEKLGTMLTNYLGEAIAARADHFKPDIMLVLAQAPMPPEIINRLRAGLNIPIAFWFVENYRLIKYWERVAPCYDYFFTIQKGEFLEKLAKAGSPYAEYLPQAADPFTHKSVPLNKKEKKYYGSEISFMGAGYPNRKKFFSSLLDTSLKVWGTEWDLNTPLGKRVVNENRRLSCDEYVKIFNATDINLNLHSSTSTAGLDSKGDFINPRTFEVASCGAFQLVDKRDELGEMFIEGEEIETFGDIDELRKKIRHYAENSGERERLAKAGRSRVLKEHTFVHRMARMMSVIISREEERIEKSREAYSGVNSLRSMISRVEKPELKRFLEKVEQKMGGEDRFKLESVMAVIEDGEGALSREEAVFVMVNELLSQGF